MGILFGFVPWGVYRVLVGNIAFTVAVLVALAIAVAAPVIRRGVLQLDASATFLVLAVLSFLLGQEFLERWILRLSNAGIFLVALSSAVIGKPFIRVLGGFIRHHDGVVVHPADCGRRRIYPRAQDTAAVPRLLADPVALLGLAALASRMLLDRMTAGAGDVVRKTSSVAYSEATIDELYYLAQEHANREVGPGQEAYEVKLGAKGEPLTRDEARLSWPSTYKVRQRRR